jgi:hypothetical protein
MSRRWFILILSIMFLFALRVWIDDLSPSAKNIAVIGRNAADPAVNNDSPLYIFPEMQAFEVRASDVSEDLVSFNQNKIISPASLIDSGIIYIFPNWPEGLDVNFNEVIVDNYSALRPDPSIQFQEY